MNKLIVFILLSTIFAYGCQSYKETEVYNEGPVPFNGGFESKLKYWNSGYGKISSDNPHTGKRSLLVESDSPIMAQADQHILIPDNAETMTVSCWVKTEDVARGANFWNKAAVHFSYLDDHFIHSGTYPEAVASVSGTTDWTEYKNEYVLDKDSSIIKLQCGILGTTGKAWFDDISVGFYDAAGNSLDTKIIDDPLNVNAYFGQYDYIAPSEIIDDSVLFPIKKSKIDPTALNGFINKIKSGDFGNQKSLLIMQDNDLIVEEYFNGQSHKEAQLLQSVTKSMTSILVGIAIDKGYINSVDDPIQKYFPEYDSLFVDGKENVTIKDLLKMSPGIEWREHNPGYEDPNNMRVRELFSNDPVEFVLRRKMDSLPGEKFNYSGGFVTLAGRIIEQASDMSLGDFAVEYLFSKIGSGDMSWYNQQDNKVNTAGGLFIRPRDLMKIGQLILNNGKVNGEQIVSAEWIEESTSNLIPANLGSFYGYGYYWLHNSYKVGDKKYDAVSGLGYGGQYLIMIKELDLILVGTADNYQEPVDFFTAINNYILPVFAD